MQDEFKGSTDQQQPEPVSDEVMLRREVHAGVGRRYRELGGDVISSRHTLALIGEVAAQLASIWKVLHGLEEPEDDRYQSAVDRAAKFLAAERKLAARNIETLAMVYGCLGGLVAQLGEVAQDTDPLDTNLSKAIALIGSAMTLVKMAEEIAKNRELSPSPEADPAVSDLPPGPLPRDPHLRPIDRKDEERLQDLAHAAEDAGMVPSEPDPEKGEPS